MMLDVGDGNRVHYEVHGPPDGKPVVIVHGGPGSGAGPRWLRHFEPGGGRVDHRGRRPLLPPGVGAAA